MTKHSYPRLPKNSLCALALPATAALLLIGAAGPPAITAAPQTKAVSPPGGGVMPDVGPNPVTFTIAGGGRSFVTTQPADSVATYVIRDGQQPRVTLTAADGAGFRYAMDSYRVAATGQPTATINVDVSKTYQRIDGFGGAMTDSAAALLQRRPGAMIAALFGTGNKQAGLTIARSPMGSSDLMADGSDVHTYEDTMGSFSVAAQPSDRRQIAMLQKAKSKVGNDFKLIGTPWSAPAWAKRGGKLTGNDCATAQNEFDAAKAGEYADYFRRYVDAYSGFGLRPWLVSMQNEPQNCKTQMPTTLMSAADEIALAGALQQRLPGDVGVLGWDHNWDDRTYVDALTGSGTVDAIGYHCYAGTDYPGQTRAVPTLMTECSGFVDQSSNVAGNLGWEVAHLLIGPLRNGSTGSIYWSLAQTADGDPHLNTNEACQTCRGMLTVNPDGSFQRSQDFYFFGQFARFVRPGAIQVASTNAGNLSTVAFRDGSVTTVVVLNSSTRVNGS
ncbi:glycoside hydrolase family 30 protein [Nakamurella aerolata]|uniref:Glycosyl hydrolase family 30 TIM-barrel domain-containing protein n=1 Tax=Nakamurella aerolata TaxID=1656892 RepID=A0A849AJP7_9ACTN|nr:hypothetical protein [Nakamurella aerolata]NNG37042.1 hypothetical protein [Nakamurella aerolata]